MVKGRPKQEDRIKFLETEVVNLVKWVQNLNDEVARLNKIYVSRGTEPYKPLFDHWPGLR